MRFKVPAILGALVAAALCATPGPARAESRIVLDRVIAEPSYFEGRARVRAFVSPLTFEGALLEGQIGDLELRAGRSSLRAPHFVGQFSSSGIPLALALVIQTGFDYKEDLPAVRRAVAEVLGALPRSARVAVVAYGGQLEGGHRLESPDTAIQHVDALVPDLAPREPKLIQAGERALRSLKRAEAGEGEPAPRRVMVLVSDGRDEDPRPERYRELGKRAARESVRIHSVAYSPIDNRRPLLGLGELSKVSGGTFRWVRDPRGFAAHADNVRAEILDQPVLVAFPPAEAVAGKRLRAALGGVRSEPVRVRQLTCGGDACEGDAYCASGRCVRRADDGGVGVLGWLIRVAIAVVVLFLALLALGFALTRRDEARKQRAAAAAAGAGASGSRVAPQAPGGGPVAPQPPGGPVQAPAAGARAPASPPAGQAAAAPQVGARATGTLFVVAGPRQGQRLPLRHGFTIGKGKRCDYVVPAETGVAGKHAQLVADAAGGFTVIDLGTPTGTLVNGVRTTQMRLSPGASIRIGSVELRFFT